MGVSETIIAAMIGACATISTAVFQLLRGRVANDPKPRRSRIRAYLSILMLMLASGVAGFAYSQLRGLDTRAEIAALRRELGGQLTAQGLLATPRQFANASNLPIRPNTAATVEAIAHLPPCAVTSADALASPVCAEAAVQRVVLCAGIPAGARVRATHLYVRGTDPREAWTGVDLAGSGSGAVRIAGESFGYASEPGSDALCVDVGNWTTAHTQIARLVLDLDYVEII